jgi:hypothetical protein
MPALPELKCAPVENFAGLAIKEVGTIGTATEDIRVVPQ